MREICLMMAMVLGTLGCVSCGGGGSIPASSYNPGYGPFDADGNYVEAWADKPAKKHWWARKPAPEPQDSPARTTKPEPLVAKASPPPAKPTRSSSRPGGYRPGPSRPTSTSARAAKPKPQAVAATSAPKPRPVASTPKPKPRPVAAAKPKPQPVKVTPKKPAPRNHVVKKGDTLYGLSRKYGTSVSAIQRANGLKGTTIQLGKTLKIPR